MEFVEEHAGDALKRRIVQDHAANTPSVTTSMRVLAEILDLEPHPQPDPFADALAERRRHAPRGGTRGEAARFEEDELVASPGRVEKRQRHARRLAGAGRRDKHEIGLLTERGVELWQNVVDRQAIGKGADQAGLRKDLLVIAPEEETPPAWPRPLARPISGSSFASSGRSRTVRANRSGWNRALPFSPVVCFDRAGPGAPGGFVPRLRRHRLRRRGKSSPGASCFGCSTSPSITLHQSATSAKRVRLPRTASQNGSALNPTMSALQPVADGSSECAPPLRSA